jgi:protein ImuB
VQRWLAIHLPDWSTDRVRLWARARGKDGGAAILLVETIAEQRRVVRACPAARAAGVRPGMSVANARALLGSCSVHVEAWDAEREVAALERLGRVLDRFSPAVAASPPDGLLLGLDGLERLWGSEEQLLDSVSEFLRRSGFGVRFGVADSAAGAMAVARFGAGPCTIVPRGESSVALDGLPLAALGLDARTLEALGELDLVTVGQFASLPRAQCATRFGAEALKALDRALGRESESVALLCAPPSLHYARELDGATCDLEVLALCVRGLLELCCEELADREVGALELVVRLCPTDLSPSTTLVSVSRPSRDPAHWMALVEPRLEHLQLGFGVDRVELLASRTAPLRGAQAAGFGLGLDHGPHPDRALGELLDAWEGRFGPRSVLGVEMLDAHLPERAFRVVPLRGGSRKRAADAGRCASLERPSRLLFEPEPADVELDPDSGVLLGLRWRGERRRVVSAVGPERLCAPWWSAPLPDPRASRPPSLERDYYRVLDASGRRSWVFRRAERWFVHGEWA